MGKRFVVLMVLLSILMVSMMVGASNKGGTGLINIPTADVIGPNTLAIGYNHFGGESIANLNYGFLDNLEVGAATVNPRQGSTDLMGHVKLQLNPEEKDFPGIAVGLEGDSYYVAASKSVASGIRGHVGLGSGRFDGLFLGASMVLNPVSISTSERSWSLPITTLQAEYDGKHPNLGLNMAFTPEFGLNLSTKEFKELNLGVGFTTRF